MKKITMKKKGNLVKFKNNHETAAKHVITILLSSSLRYMYNSFRKDKIIKINRV